MKRELTQCVECGASLEPGANFCNQCRTQYIRGKAKFTKLLEWNVFLLVAGVYGFFYSIITMNHDRSGDVQGWISGNHHYYDYVGELSDHENRIIFIAVASFIITVIGLCGILRKFRANK